MGASAMQSDKNAAEGMYNEARGEARGYNTQAAGQGASEFGKIDPTSRAAMMSALADYQNKARMGGLDARGQAALEGTQARAAQTAATSTNQIQQEAARRGRLQGPASMIQAQVAGQQGAELAHQGGFEAAAMSEQAKDAALQGSMGAAQGVYGMDANKAAAQDAINRFNVQNAQMNIANNRAKAAQLIGIDTGEAGMYEGRQKGDVAQFTGIGKGIGSSVGAVGESLFSMGAGGGAGAGYDYLNPGGQGGT